MVEDEQVGFKSYRLISVSNFVKADYFKEFSKDIVTAKTPWETKAKREGIALIFSMFLALLSLLKKHVS